MGAGVATGWDISLGDDAVRRCPLSDGLVYSCGGTGMQQSHLCRDCAARAPQHGVFSHPGSPAPFVARWGMYMPVHAACRDPLPCSARVTLGASADTLILQKALTPAIDPNPQNSDDL